MGDPTPPSLEDVLELAADFQRLVPGAVLVGGSAAAFHARHRRSLDHDHVIADLADRFDTILEHLEAVGDWSMARAQPGKIILGELGGIETGLRQRWPPKSYASWPVPRPRDAKATSELASYKGLEARWHQWDAVISVLRDVAQAMLR